MSDAPDVADRMKRGTLPEDLAGLVDAPATDEEAAAALAAQRKREDETIAQGKEALVALLQRAEAGQLDRQEELARIAREGREAEAVKAMRSAEHGPKGKRVRAAKLAALAPMGRDRLANPPPERDVLLWQPTPDMKREPLVHRGVVGLVVAPGGAGKTQALVQMAVAVASGTDWLGYQVDRPGKVLLALAEEDDEEIQRRVYRTLAHAFEYEETREKARALVAENLYPLGLRGCPVALMGQHNEPDADWLATLRAKLEQQGPWSLLVLDPLSRWGGPDVETDNHAATQAITLLEQLTELADQPAVLMAHHTNKGALAGNLTNQGAARGSSGLVDGGRWTANMDLQPEPDRVRFHVSKANYTARRASIMLKRCEGGVLRLMDQKELQAIANEDRKAQKPQPDSIYGGLV